jgi:monooxygenase
MTSALPDQVDVLIIGAGLSGIGAACHLRRDCPERSVAVLEAREATGGTWDLFRYPGVRSDSDMHTLGYDFEPWRDGQALADGPSILRYIRRVATEHGVQQLVRTRHRATAASFDSRRARWTVRIQTPTGERECRCRFLLLCTGYYRYEAGYTPPLPGLDRFEGRLVHPQSWPEDLDWAGQRVVVIGSGATAVTLVPALAQRAAHVTMLQRSPSYVISMPGRDELAERLSRRVGERLAYAIVRWRNVALMMASYGISRRWPRLMRGLIRRGAIRQLPAGYAVDTHFNPSYDPWDQRLCVVPDGDLFAAIAAGRASVLTDEIQTFTAGTIRTRSGRELAADLVVTATGLALLALGGISLDVDGDPVHLPERTAYKAMMLSGVPNLAFTVGYTNASWTLKADLTARYVGRLLRHMAREGYDLCVAQLPPGGVGREPLIALRSGYVQRSLRDFPVQGTHRPWRVHQNYALDVLDLRRGRLEDGVMRFARIARPAGDLAQPALVGLPVD